MPATMKSGAVSMAPRESMPHRYGVQVPGSRPAMTGDTNHGPNLQQQGHWHSARLDISSALPSYPCCLSQTNTSHIFQHLEAHEGSFQHVRHRKPFVWLNVCCVTQRQCAKQRNGSAVTAAGCVKPCTKPACLIGDEPILLPALSCPVQLQGSAGFDLLRLGQTALEAVCAGQKLAALLMASICS